MFGTMVCNIFAEHKLFQHNQTINKKFLSSINSSINAHGTGYKDILDTFHGINDLKKLKKIKNLQHFFQPLENKGLSIHRLGNWEWLSIINFKNYFNNFVIGLLVPEKSEINIWAERFFESSPKFKHEEWWMNNVKKDMSKLPYWFKRGMSIKEKAKYIKSQFKFVKENRYLDQTVQIDPKFFFYNDKFQNFCNQCCEKINIPNFQIPSNKIKDFLELNKKKIGFDKILK